MEIVSVNHKTFSSIEKGYKRSTLYIKGGVSEFRVPLCGSEGILQVNNRHLNKGVGLTVFLKFFLLENGGFFPMYSSEKKYLFFGNNHKILKIFSIICMYRN